MTDHGSVFLQSPADAGFRFEARFPSGRVTVFDSGPEAAAPNPVEHLIASLAACQAMDVLGILRKRRLTVTAYEISMAGERAGTPPRRFTAIELVHRLTAHGLTVAEVEEALRLSEQKYCSVQHTLDPAMALTRRVEVREG